MLKKYISSLSRIMKKIWLFSWLYNQKELISSIGYRSGDILSTCSHDSQEFLESQADEPVPAGVTPGLCIQRTHTGQTAVDGLDRRGDTSCPLNTAGCVSDTRRRSYSAADFSPLKRQAINQRVSSHRGRKREELVLDLPQVADR